MLAGVDTLTMQLSMLKPSGNPIDAATKLIDVIAKYFDQVQAGPFGKAGIFTYNKEVAIPLIAALPPVPDQSWIMPFANAIHAGALAATLSPGTVSFPGWIISEVDIIPPVIVTIPVAKNILIGALTPVTATNNPPMPLAQALDLYIKSFVFLATGITLIGIVPAPLPLPFPAQ
jgi:hypothetical protein